MTTYAPGPIPADPKAQQRYLGEEFRKVQAALKTANQYDILYVEPTKPRAGLVVYADGTTWDPGSGEGLYRYSLAGAWEFVG